MAIHQVDDEWVISAYRVWRPGVYESDRAARYAQRFGDEELTAAQAAANEKAGGAGGVITLEQLRALKRRRPRREA